VTRKQYPSVFDLEIRRAGRFTGLFGSRAFLFKEMNMAGITETNAALGAARDAVYQDMKDLLTNADPNTGAGAKSAALLDAQATLGITDGVQNIIAKGYNRWTQTGQ